MKNIHYSLLFTTLITVIIAVLILPMSISQETETMEKMAMMGEEGKLIKLYLMTDSGQLIDNSLVLVNVKTSGRTVSSFSKYVVKGMPMEIQLEEGRWEIEVLADDLTTPGKDYYGTESTDSGSSNITVHLLPSGTLSGTVLDSLDNRIVSAEVRIKCLREYGSEKPEKTDKFGSFVYEYAPAGECTVSGMYKGSVGSEKVAIVQGKVSNIEIKLDQSIVSRENNYLVYLGVCVITLVSVYLYIFKFRIKKEKRGIAQKQALPQRARDIMATLREDEKKVIELILNEGCSATQAKVYYKTGIPKTTLSRCVKNLESKGIVTTEQSGKMKKITLTGWFMGKS